MLLSVSTHLRHACVPHVSDRFTSIVARPAARADSLLFSFIHSPMKRRLFWMPAFFMWIAF
jgi:hypothetical protein